MRTMLPTEAWAAAVVKCGCVTATESFRSADEPAPLVRASSAASSWVTVAGWSSLRPVSDGTTAYVAPHV